MRQRYPELDSYRGTVCTRVGLIAPDEKRETNWSNNDKNIDLIVHTTSFY